MSGIAAVFTIVLFPQIPENAKNPPVPIISGTEGSQITKLFYGDGVLPAEYLACL